MVLKSLTNSGLAWAAWRAMKLVFAWEGCLATMKIQNLKTLIAVSEHRSFVEAGEAIGLSHSAVSLHMKALEDELGALLFDRSYRPPKMMDRGRLMVAHARRLMDILDDISALSSNEALKGSLSVGVVHSALINLLPPALAMLKAMHPNLEISLKTGLSGDLAQRVRRQEIDVAIIVDPGEPIEDLISSEVCVEPLFVLAPRNTKEETAEAILTSHPYIWYDRMTATGRQIRQHLRDRKITVENGIEVESLEAVEQLVRHGLGVSVAPKTTCGSDDFCDEVRVVSFGSSPPTRTLILVERSRNPRQHLVKILLAQLLMPADEIRQCLVPSI